MKKSRLWPIGTNGPPEATYVAFVGTTMLLGTTKFSQKIYFPIQNSNGRHNSPYIWVWGVTTRFFCKFAFLAYFHYQKFGKNPKIQNFPKFVWGIISKICLDVFKIMTKTSSFQPHMPLWTHIASDIFGALMLRQVALKCGSRAHPPKIADIRGGWRKLDFFQNYVW